MECKRASWSGQLAFVLAAAASAIGLGNLWRFPYLAARYGGRVKGWWIDGCYDDFLSYTPELLRLYAEAAKAGNPDSLVAMNNGVFPTCRKYGPDEDFTAGEFNDFFCVPEKRFVDGAQAFQLARWGNGTATIPAGAGPDASARRTTWRGSCRS